MKKIIPNNKKIYYEIEPGDFIFAKNDDFCLQYKAIILSKDDKGYKYFVISGTNKFWVNKIFFDNIDFVFSDSKVVCEILK